MIEAYKGFNKFENCIECKGYIFEEGKTFTLNKPPILCCRGFHACLDPLNVLDYYMPLRAYTIGLCGVRYPVYLYPDRRCRHWYTITYPYKTLHVGTEYHKVYIEGDVDADPNIFTEHTDDTKLCTNKIRIGEKINLDDIMQIHLKLLDEFERECAPWLDAMNCSSPHPMRINKSSTLGEPTIAKYCCWLARKMLLCSNTNEQLK